SEAVAHRIRPASLDRADMCRLGLRSAPAVDELPPGDCAARVVGMQHRAAERPVAERAIDQGLDDRPLDLERHLRVLHAVWRGESSPTRGSVSSSGRPRAVIRAKSVLESRRTEACALAKSRSTGWPAILCGTAGSNGR